MTPKTTALAAFEISGLAPPPAPIPFRAPNMPGQVNAVAATMNAEKIVPRYHVTGCFSSSDMMNLKILNSVFRLESRSDAKGRLLISSSRTLVGKI